MSQAATSAPAAPATPKSGLKKFGGRLGGILIAFVAFVVLAPSIISRVPVVERAKEQIFALYNDRFDNQVGKIDPNASPIQQARQYHAAKVEREASRGYIEKLPQNCPSEHNNNYTDVTKIDLGGCQSGDWFPLLLPRSERFKLRVYSLVLYECLKGTDCAKDADRVQVVAIPEIKTIDSGDGLSVAKARVVPDEFYRKEEGLVPTYFDLRGEVKFAYQGKGRFLELKLVKELTPESEGEK